MRCKPCQFVPVALGLLLAACAGPGPGLTGNDTGGIIPWSPDAEAAAAAIAGAHCSRFGRGVRITSVHRRYGDYIGFVCL